MPARRLRLAFGGVLALAVAGCETAATTVAGSMAVTAVDKTISDYTKMECRVLELLRTGNLCKPPPPPRPIAQVYCFKTIGAVECYESEDPFGFDSVARTPRQPALADPVDVSPETWEPPHAVASATGSKPPPTVEQAPIEIAPASTP